MINLLPPDQKEQMRYARLNRLAISYLKVLVLVVVVLAMVFAGAFYYLNRQVAGVTQDISEKEANIASYKVFQKTAQEASDRLTSIKTIQASQTRFSALLADLAKVLPKTVSLDSITLTGDDKKPVRFAITATSYQAVLEFRNALQGAPRISGVDLENITQTGSTYQASVIAGFKAGQAK